MGDSFLRSQLAHSFFVSALDQLSSCLTAPFPILFGALVWVSADVCMLVCAAHAEMDVYMISLRGSPL